MRNGIDVRIRKYSEYDDKWWVEIIFPEHYEDTWIPSFNDLFRIIQAICLCEDWKYPNGKGRAMVGEFLEACWPKGVEWEQLRHQFSIPLRRY